MRQCTKPCNIKLCESIPMPANFPGKKCIMYLVREECDSNYSYIHVCQSECPDTFFRILTHCVHQPLSHSSYFYDRRQYNTSCLLISTDIHARFIPPANYIKSKTRTNWCVRIYCAHFLNFYIVWRLYTYWEVVNKSNT